MTLATSGLRGIEMVGGWAVTWPAAHWLSFLALAFIAKARRAQRFDAKWQQTAAMQPALLAWPSRRPIHAPDLADRRERLPAIVASVQTHPRPGVHLRQVDAPGVDSKLIEAHRGLLADQLDLGLPPEVIETGGHDRQAPCRGHADQLPDTAGGAGRAVPRAS
jgi:hypothetical protein